MRARFLFLAIVFFLSLAPCRVFIAPAFASTEAAEYLCELGRFLSSQNRFDEALVEFKKALVVDPGNKTARQQINEIFQKEISFSVPSRQSSTPKSNIVSSKKTQKSNLTPAANPPKSNVIPKRPEQPKTTLKEQPSRSEIKPLAKKENTAPPERKPSRDEEINKILSDLGKNKPERKKIAGESEPKELADIPVKLGGEVRIGLGFTGKDAIWKEANADKIGVPREKNWRYLWGDEQYNTYDKKIYDRLSLNMQTKFRSPFNAYVEVTADPWTFLGKNHVDIPANDGTGDSVEMDLKYWSADSSVINETYRSRAGRIVRLKEIKVHNGDTTTSGMVVAPSNNVFGTIQPMDVKRVYRPLRKMWFDYKQDDYVVKLFPVSDQYEALTSDDPLKISNNHVYWEESPWLDSYEPSRTFYDDVTVPNPVTFIKKGKWVRSMSYFTRDSSDDYPHRLTFLRGLSFKADPGPYSLEGALATPLNLWDDYRSASSVHGALKLKVPVGNSLDLGFTTTSKVGLHHGAREALNQVESFEAAYKFSDTAKAYAQISESHTDVSEELDNHTRYDGVGTKVGFAYDAQKNAKSGIYQGEFYYAHLDNNFYPALSNYRYTRTDSQSFARHIYFSGINPDD